MPAPRDDPWSEPEPQPSTEPRRPPTPQPTPTGQACNVAKFSEWWFSLQSVGNSVRPGMDWYDYEQRVARAGGLYGNCTRTVPTGGINADGIEPSQCDFVDAKYTSDPSNTKWRPDGPPWIIAGLLNEFKRYKASVDISNGIPGAQPRGLIVRTPYATLLPFFQQMLTQAGFVIGVNGSVQVVP
jgi:hypothetical protein